MEKNRKSKLSSFFVGSKGIQIEVIYFKGFIEKLKTQYASLDGKVVLPLPAIEGMGSSNKHLLVDIKKYLGTDPLIFENV